MTSIHTVDYSPWPLYVSIALVTLVISSSMILPLIALILVAILWFRDITREGIQGHHTRAVTKGLVVGFILFLVTEVMLFFSFFWAYFHSSISAEVSLGLLYPPIGIDAVSYASIPLLGSFLLLSSGFFVTLSHHSFISGDKAITLISGVITLLLGLLFVILQVQEWSISTFTLADSVYGSVFYMVTGLHGIHVIIGLIFLLIAYIRIYHDHLTLQHLLIYEFAILYYHLVDVIWLFLFVTLYWFGAGI